MKQRLWVLGFLAVGLLGVSREASADPPATAGAFQLAAGFRYGFEMNEGDANPWGPGLGLSAGYTLESGPYLGGVFDYFFGDSEESPSVEVSANVWQLMAEGGYDLGAGSFVIRPKVGVGMATTSVEICSTLAGFEGCEDDSETDFALAPGVTAMYIGSKISLSVDLRYDLIFAEDTGKALIFSAGIGF